MRREAVSSQSEGLVLGLTDFLEEGSNPCLEISPGGPGREMQRQNPGVLTSKPSGSEGPSLDFGPPPVLPSVSGGPSHSSESPWPVELKETRRSTLRPGVAGSSLQLLPQRRTGPPAASSRGFLEGVSRPIGQQSPY